MSPFYPPEYNEPEDIADRGRPKPEGWLKAHILENLRKAVGQDLFERIEEMTKDDG